MAIARPRFLPERFLYLVKYVRARPTPCTVLRFPKPQTTQTGHADAEC